MLFGGYVVNNDMNTASRQVGFFPEIGLSVNPLKGVSSGVFFVKPDRKHWIYPVCDSPYFSVVLDHT